MNTINVALTKALESVDRPGDFHASGRVEFMPPRLEVTGVGPIALPLLPIQAEQLAATAEPAPYGKGEATLIDPTVRRTWQIGPDRVRIEGKHWPATLETIVRRVTAGLGVTTPVAAELYKLLIYDAGSFFMNHRDTEKAPGMFATLVVVLPSIYTGGELVVRHREREARLDLSCSDPAELAYAAFYADCMHEVLPITSGCRLALIYNLCRRDGGAAPTPPDHAAAQAHVANLLCGWAEVKREPEDTTPEKLIYILEHAYTPAELSFAALKGADAAVAAVLRGAAEHAACELHLALVSIEEDGYAEHTGGYYGYRRDRYYDDDGEDFEIGEVTDRRLHLTHWCKPDDERQDMPAFPFDEAELCPPGTFDDLDPDELHFHEATGNEGASFERTYQRAGLILWPRGRRFAVFNQVGLGLTMPYLGQLTKEWENGGGRVDSSLWRQACELVGHMLRTWPRSNWRYEHDTATETAEMLDLLIRLRDTEPLAAFLAEVSAQGAYVQADNPTLARAIGLLPPSSAPQLLRAIVAGNADKKLNACTQLLALVAEKHGENLNLMPAASALLEALPGAPASTQPGFRPTARLDGQTIADMFAVLIRIAPLLAERAAEQVLGFPETYGIDAILLPAMARLANKDETRDTAAVARLRAACLDHLRARIAEPLAPPRDWSRPSALACRCQHCAALSRFLADPVQKTWTLKAVQASRDHVSDMIKRANPDLDLRTDTSGRPYTLVCVKNQAGFDRRARQRERDLDYLSMLGARNEGNP